MSIDFLQMLKASRKSSPLQIELNKRFLHMLEELLEASRFAVSVE
jgi:hypothetical protein